MGLDQSIDNQLFALVGISTVGVLIMIGILAKIYEKSMSKYHPSLQ
jgi:hypothetical protein